MGYEDPMEAKTPCVPSVRYYVARASMVQPIETAPRDRWILVWLRGNKSFGEYSEQFNERWVSAKWTGEDNRWAGWSYPGVGGLLASHWAPLPPAPTLVSGWTRHCIHGIDVTLTCIYCGPVREMSPKPEPNFLFDVGADFCDRHETAFKLGERCPKCPPPQTDMETKP